MKKRKSLFSQLYKKAILYGLVDEGGWFSQMLASRKTIAEYTKLTKNFSRNQRNLRQKIRVNLCESVKSVSNFPSCLGVFVAGIQSIKTTKLCKTNPISDMSKMSLTNYMTKSCGNNSDLLTMEKQTQNEPNQTQFLVKMGNYKQDS